MKKIIIFSIMFVLALPGVSQVTSGKGFMRGIVIDRETEGPIQGVTLKLYSVRAGAFHKPFPVTGEDGRWHASFIRTGEWHIDCVKPGYETRKISFLVQTLIGVGGKRPMIKTYMIKSRDSAFERNILKDIKKVVTLYEKTMFYEALQELKKLSKKYEEDSVINLIYQYIGNCYAGLEDYDKAIEYYKKALENSSDKKNLIIAIGNAYTNLKMQDKALEWYKKVSLKDIKNSITLYNIGIIHLNNQKYEEAIIYFKKVININQDLGDVLYHLGMAYTATDNMPEAVTIFKEFMRIAPNSDNFQTAKAIVDAFNPPQ